MFDDLSLSFFGRQLREGHNSSQHLADIGCGEGWQSFDFELLSQFGVALAIISPIELNRGDEPQSANGQSGVVLPGDVLLSLKLIGAHFIFAILDQPFNKVTTTQLFSYDDLYRLTSARAISGRNGLGDYGPESYSYNPTTGNLASKAGVSYTYGDGFHKHAVTSLSNGNTYAYDANGNMTYRLVNGQANSLTYDAENRLVQVSGAVTETFKYNGDGQRIIATQGMTTTVYIGSYFEWKGSTSSLVKYRCNGKSRVKGAERFMAGKSARRNQAGRIGHSLL